MSIDRILAEARSLDGILILAPEPGGPFPEIAWGDSFLYYAPNGEVPTNRQPFATIVTKDYPDDDQSHLGGGRWRVNLHVGRERFIELLDAAPGDAIAADDAADDVFLPHPVYGALGWVSVVNPGDRTLDRVLALMRAAYDGDRARVERRHPAP